MVKGKKTGALNRRWFADMSGWGLSLQVGSGDPVKGKRSLPVNPDSKFLATYVSVGNATHDTLYSYNPLSVIVNGTGPSQRIGSAIKLKGISFRFTVDGVVSSTTANPTIWRVMLVASTVQGNVANFGTVLGSSNLFFSTAVTLPVNSHVDSRVAKLICDQTFETKPRIAATPDNLAGFVDCEINMPFEFQSGSVFGVSSNLYLVVTPHVAAGVSGTTVAGNITGEVLVCWTD